MPGGKTFCVPWPRSVIRAANVRLDHTLKLGKDATVVIERCQSGTEGLALRFAVDPPQEVTLRLFGDEARLDVVEQEVEPASGKGTVRAYPLLRPHRTLRIEVGPKGARGTKALQSVSVDIS
jgi:hypothetical protein